ESGIELLVRLVVGDVDPVVPVDVNPARPAKLPPLLEEISVLVEDLDAAVAAVADEQAPLRVHRERVRRVELAVRTSLLAPRLDELPFRGELNDARVRVPAVAVSDEDVPVRRGEHIGGPV